MKIIFAFPRDARESPAPIREFRTTVRTQLVRRYRRAGLTLDEYLLREPKPEPGRDRIIWEAARVVAVWRIVPKRPDCEPELTRFDGEGAYDRRGQRAEVTPFMVPVGSNMHYCSGRFNETVARLLKIPEKPAVKQTPCLSLPRPTLSPATFTPARPRVVWIYYIDRPGPAALRYVPWDKSVVRVTVDRGESPFPYGAAFYGLERGKPYPDEDEPILSADEVDYTLSLIEAGLPPQIASVVHSARVVVVFDQEPMETIDLCRLRRLHLEPTDG